MRLELIFIKCLIFLIFICTAFLSMHINKDIFSPAKWFVLHFSVYFFDIYLGDYSFEDHLLVLLTIISISFIVFLDRPLSITHVHTTPAIKKTGSKTHLFFIF